MGRSRKTIPEIIALKNDTSEPINRADRGQSILLHT